MLSHPCARKKAQGWGTELLCTIFENAFAKMKKPGTMPGFLWIGNSSRA
jgi:hypothetical protein